MEYITQFKYKQILGPDLRRKENESTSLTTPPGNTVTQTRHPNTNKARHNINKLINDGVNSLNISSLVT